MNMPTQDNAFAIETDKLCKTYPSSGKNPPKEALRDINLKVPRGSIFGLLGPNGAGKSTFINILAGLTTKSSGHARIWGFDIDSNPRQAAVSIGVVPQELSIDAYFSPLEILDLQAGLYNVPPSKRRSMEILRAMDLEDRAHVNTRSLSGGMRRRLLVAKALAHDPPVMILDEPTAGVDVDLRRHLWEYMKQLRERGATIVLTTHYLAEAQELCDEIAIIDKGSVIVCEPTQDLLHRIDRKTLKVVPEAPVNNIPETLEEEDAHVDEDGRLCVSYRRGEESVGVLLDKIRQGGVGIRDVSVDEADLEEVFLRLTREEKHEYHGA